MSWAGCASIYRVQNAMGGNTMQFSSNIFRWGGGETVEKEKRKKAINFIHGSVYGLSLDRGGLWMMDNRVFCHCTLGRIRSHCL